MRFLESNPVQVAERYIKLNVVEAPGEKDNALVLAMLRLYNPWVEHDETAWCSAFAAFVCFQLGVEHSKKLNARSWLDIGIPVALTDGEIGFDIVVLKRGTNPMQGHIGFFYGVKGDFVYILGGNQRNSVNVMKFPAADVLGVRRLA